jgi:hypothetical protein
MLGREKTKGKMKIIIRALMAVGVIVIVSGCASTKQYVHFPDQNKSIENPEKARIYVARPTSLGGVISMKVSDEGQAIGETGPNGYLCWECTPGKTTIKGKAENTSELNLNTEKGKSYYIQQHVRMGILMARNKLELLNDAEGKEKVSKCKPPKQ